MIWHLCKGDIIRTINKKVGYKACRDLKFDDNKPKISKRDFELVKLIPKEELIWWQRFLLWAGYDFGFGHRDYDKIKESR